MKIILGNLLLKLFSSKGLGFNGYSSDLCFLVTVPFVTYVSTHRRAAIVSPSYLRETRNTNRSGPSFKKKLDLLMKKFTQMFVQMVLFSQRWRKFSDTTLN